MFKRKIQLIKQLYHLSRKLILNETILESLYDDIPNLLKFKNLHEGEDCFIVCNGPSLNKMDLSKLNDYYVFGLNKIYLILEKQKINFDYLVAVNTLVIEQAEATYKTLKMPIFLSKHAKVEDSKNFYFLNTNDSHYYFAKSFQDQMSQSHTVTYVALQLAYIMGFKNVYLIGADHNFDQKGKPNSKQKMVLDDVNHFHPDYFKGQDWQLADLSGSEIAYMIAKRKYIEDNRYIYNSTLGGKLEIFERKSFEEALKSAKKRNS